MAGVCTRNDVKALLSRNLGDTTDDALIDSKILATTDALEARLGRWLTDRGAGTWTTGGTVSREGKLLIVKVGIRSVTTLEVAPSDGAAFAVVPAAEYALWPDDFDRSPGWPATGIRLVETSTTRFPGVEGTVRITGQGGWATVPARVSQIGALAIWRSLIGGGSGGADYTIAGRDGGERILAYIAPGEWDELFDVYGGGL